MAPNSTTSTVISTEQVPTLHREKNRSSTNNNGILKTENSEEYSTKTWRDFFAKLKWFNITLITVIHSIFFWGFFNYPYSESGKLMLFTYVVGFASAIGVTAGAHRLWTHRAYKAKLPLRIILMLLYCTAGHNPLFHWVRDHRVHHKYTDTHADPHNSKRGFFFAHCGWLMMKKHPEVIRRGKEIDMSDVLADPVIQFHQKYYLPLVLSCCFIIPSIIPPLCWGQCWIWSILTSCVARYVIALNITWSVNSAAHMWGAKPFDKRISASENLWVSLWSLGEGWHNYHHAFPWDYKTSELGRYSVNISKLFIDAFAKIGWAYDLKSPSSDLVRKVALKTGDNSHPVWGELEINELAEEEIFQCSLYNDEN